MKKLILLFLTLLLGVTASWADGLKVSTTESASAEYQYKIFCRNASTYYLGSTTNATNSSADYGLFAFFEDTSGDYTNGYYIYSIFEGKWVTYTAGTSYSGGQDKISLVADKPSVPWNIAADNSDEKYYDIRPFKTDDKTADTQSWNWHGGAASNTSHTMGFYGYTDGNSGWGIVLAGGSGSPVADRKVVALYNVPNDNNQYALYNSNGTPKVYNSITGVTPQYFVLRQNGLDTNGEALYRLQKAEMDGYSLNYQTFGEGLNYMFLNTSSYFYNKFTITTSNNPSPAESPYYNLYRVYPNTTDNSSRPYANQVAQCNDAVVNMFSGPSDNLPAQLTAKGSWNGRWQIVEQSYTAWQVIMSGATSGTITYSGSALISGGTATQSNNGMFVLNAAPASSDFTTSFVEGYLSDPVITIDDKRKIIKVVYTSYTDTYNTITTALSTAPEGIGYPTTTARTRLQAAIDAFDASKTTANLAALSTQYNSFRTNVLLPEGKVYTIQNYIKNPTPSTTTYLKNEDGTLTIGAEASATALNNLWVVRKSGDTYVLQSAADPTKYIVYNSFTLNATGSAWTLSCGTEWPYISLYNSVLARYIACNGSDRFGTANGNYYASAKTQYSGWSTDFKFVESEDYALYKVKIIYPSGSAPTVTYSGNDYSNGGDFVAPTTLAVGDLTVSEISGYTPTVTIDGDIVYVYYNMAVAAPYADTWDFDTAPWLLLNDAPAAIDNPSRTYRYNTKRINIATTYNSSVEVVFAYTAGDFRIDVAGVDLIDPSTGDVVKGDYHDGYSGGAQSNKEYTIRDVAPGNYILRYISYDQSTSSAGNISVRVVPGQGFYRLKNVATDKYLTATATGAWNSSTRVVYANGSNTDASTVIRLFDKDSNGTLYMYNQGYGFGWTATNAGGGVAWITGNPDKYVHWFSGTATGRLAFAICYGNGTGGYADYLEKGIYTADTEDNAVIAGTDYADNKAQWVIEPAETVTVSMHGDDPVSPTNYYATFCAPFSYTVESGTTAYTLEDMGTYLKPTAIDGEVTAGTPVLLKGTSSTATLTIGTEWAATPVDGDLTGTYLAKTIVGGTDYVLGIDKGVVGFYHWNSNNLGANRAYVIGDGSSVKGFVLSWDDETGIKNLNVNDNLNKVVYDLSGRRIQKPTKGLYIVNGKKVMVK